MEMKDETYSERIRPELGLCLWNSNSLHHDALKEAYLASPEATVCYIGACLHWVNPWRQVIDTLIALGLLTGWPQWPDWGGLPPWSLRPRSDELWSQWSWAPHKHIEVYTMHTWLHESAAWTKVSLRYLHSYEVRWCQTGSWDSWCPST